MDITTQITAHPLRQRIRALVEAPLFERSIVTLILLNAAILGLETVPEMVARNESGMEIRIPER